VGELEVAGVTASGRLLLALGAADEEEAACSRSRCLALALRRFISTLRTCSGVIWRLVGGRGGGVFGGGGEKSRRR